MNIATFVLVSPDDTTNTGTDQFIAEDVNVSDCVSSLPRPECGRVDQSNTGQMFTFGLLMAGMAFIGWRIARGVRQRDRMTSAPHSDDVDDEMRRSE